VSGLRRLVPAIAALAALLSPAPPLAAQGGELRGEVTGPGGAPLAGALVTVSGAGGGSLAAVTDAFGRFRLEGLPAGADLEVRVRALGHAPARLAATPGRELRVRLQERPLALSPVEVVGVSARSIARVPGSLAVVHGAALAPPGATSTSEALRRVAGVQVNEEDPFGLYVNIGVRGLNPRRSARVLLLENGAPIHLAPYGDPQAHYQPPPWSLARVEVLKGSGQILHGPQSVGGVINYVRVPPARAREVELLGGSHSLAAGRVRLGEVRGPWGYLLEGSRRSGGGPRSGWAHTVDDAAAVLRWLGGGQSLTGRAGAYRERSDWGETGLTQAEFEADPRMNPSPHDAFALDRLHAQLVHELELGGDAALSTLVYGQRLERTAWRQASDSRDRFGSERYAQRYNCPPEAASLEECGNQGRPRSYRFAGIEPRLGVGLRLGGAEGRLEVGLRAHRESAVRRQTVGATPHDRDGTVTRDNAILTDALAAFAQLRLEAGRWALTPGVRAEHVRSANENRIQELRLADRYTQLLPGLGATFAPRPRVTLFAGTHRGFAPPRPADILSPAPGEGLVQVDPEVSWNSEVGVRARPGPRAALEATAFRIDFDNQVIEGSLAGSGQRFVNAGRTLHAGLELSGSLGSARGAELAASYTFLPVARFRGEALSAVDGETPVAGNRLPYAARHALSLSAGHTLASTTLRLHADHLGERFADDLETRAPTADGMRGVLPSHTLLGASLTHARGAFELRLAGRNLTDAVYVTERQHGVLVGMPRTLSAGLLWRP
jgi:Fe(3+) dicitrate transport protein